MAADAGDDGVLNELDGIGGAGVLRELDVGVVGLAGAGSRTTFSSTEPKRMAWKICGSFSSLRSTHLA
jgi:hypothetical protein